ncbi:RtcB family protein [Thermodesulfatator autotrophicus]|uniref:tRNA-splicing ligase RtcB n=1 Tax=Thermodesulfatator autotrophicus TaxID=1795632 RepID=A0A177E886_9BACT|nr:RtcB family protein [Thermodesulfatator autotrophicus]OAG27640.1 RNA-splicing ligase RtcB [Thermodesulfatator autotrophicus]
MELKSLVKISEYEWEIPRKGSMRVPGRIFASKKLIEEMDEKVREQVTNVACLPGIVRASIAMPDAHWGYGFPIGGVAAFDPDDDGIISVGGVGYDISCGVRSLRTGLKREEVEPVLEELIDALFHTIPAGVGSEGKIKLSISQLDEVLVGGARWAVANGYGEPEDLEYIEEKGCLPGADPKCVSIEAKKRQHRQVGTLGSGNHYLEVQYVAEIYHREAAEAFGLEVGDVVISIHCGSRALGHQIATDYLKVLAKASKKYGIPIKEKELVCAPIRSPEGEQYYRAMACGVNCALANRQVITHLVREVFAEIIPEARITVIYDVSHNTCKVEKHKVNGRVKELYVHRKGATRAWGPGRPELPARYRHVGQPVIIGGSMGTASYILVGTEEGEEKAFGSACHGAGRTMSRHQALKRWRADQIVAELRKKGIIVRAKSKRGLVEEAPEAYKDVIEVVEVAHRAGLAHKVAKLLPMGCIKG